MRRTALAIAAFLTLTACAPSAPTPGHAHHKPPASQTQPSDRPSGAPSGAPSGDPAATRGVSRASIVALLSRVEVLPEEPYAPGYDRACDPGACVFGPEWTDRSSAPLGHNGCDTREDVVRLQFEEVELRWGSRCRIYQGVLHEPYTGERMTWRDDGYFIQIDHVYPLASAWYGGAWSWPQARRVAFANDVRRELLAVSGQANQAKISQTPAEWLPPNRAFRCEYVWRYLRVAVAYDLPISRADALAITRVSQSRPCQDWR